MGGFPPQKPHLMGSFPGKARTDYSGVPGGEKSSMFGKVGALKGKDVLGKGGNSSSDNAEGRSSSVPPGTLERAVGKGEKSGGSNQSDVSHLKGPNLKGPYGQPVSDHYAAGPFDSFPSSKG